MADTVQKNDFMGRVNTAIRRTDEAYDQVAKRLGFTSSAFDILYTLRSIGEGCSQKDLAEASCTGKQTINSAIHRMEDAGVLRLEPGTGRVTRVLLTDAGRRLVQERIDPVIAAEEKAAASLPQRDQDALARAFEDYADAVCASLGSVPAPGTQGRPSADRP